MATFNPFSGAGSSWEDPPHAPNALNAYTDTSAAIMNHQQAPPQRPAAVVVTRKRRKAKRYRRRHVPVGPAGIWFQTQQQINGSSTEGTGSRSSLSLSIARKQMQGESEEDEEGETANAPLSFATRNGDMMNSAGAAVGGVNFYSNAWMCMQCQLELTTPSLPTYLSVSQRYDAIRQHLPNHYLLLSEIKAGKVDWRMPSDVSLLVLVHSIQSITDNLWTVQLMDETGCSITAWMQPTLVQQEQQQPVPSYIRTGLVWLLEEASIQLIRQDGNNSSTGGGGDEQQLNFSQSSEGDETDLVNNNSDGNVKVDRLLLVSESNIRRVWTPAQAEQEVTDKDYIAWMERRNSLTVNNSAVAAVVPIGLQSPRPNGGVSHSQTTTSRGSASQSQRRNQQHGNNNEGSESEEEEEFTFGDSQPSPPERPASRPAAEQDVAPRIQSLHAVKSPAPAAPASRERIQPQSSQRISQVARRTTPIAMASQSQAVPQNSVATDFRQFASASSQQVGTTLQSPLLVPRNPMQPTTAPSGQPTMRSQNATVNHSPRPPQQQRARSKERLPQAPNNLQQFAATPAGELPKPNDDGQSSVSSAVRTPPPNGALSTGADNSMLSKSRSGANKTTSSKKKRKKASRGTTAPTTSPKATPSNLWANADASLLDMFEDEDDADDDDGHETVVPAQSVTQPAAVPVPTNTAPVQELPSVPDDNSTKPVSSLFQASAFAGMDMDDLFDDEEGGDDD